MLQILLSLTGLINSKTPGYLARARLGQPSFAQVRLVLRVSAVVNPFHSKTGPERYSRMPGR